ncbi:MAG TPA: hypothetical protein VFR47_09345 [Anaerolineales bacterium]|nr:hypothetical protein [Anaerolineales bacterium]
MAYSFGSQRLAFAKRPEGVLPERVCPYRGLVGFGTPGFYPECYAIEGVVNHQAGREDAAWTELGTIPAFFAGTGLCVVYSSFRVHVVDCRHGDVRSGAVLGGVANQVGLRRLM